MARWIVAAVALALAAAAGAPLTGTERNRAVSELHATRKLLLDAISGLSEAQWRFRPGEGRWTIAEIAEHVALSEDLYFENITGRILRTPPAPARKAEVQVTDDQVIAIMADRTNKRETGEANRPTGRWTSASEIEDHFKRSRDRMIGYVQTSRDDLRSHFSEHRATGLIDAYQWILLSCGHVERHVAQIREVKAAPGYPGP
jgi:uncharacterized damage-inducible protein DinB